MYLFPKHVFLKELPLEMLLFIASVTGPIFVYTMFNHLLPVIWNKKDILNKQISFIDIRLLRYQRRLNTLATTATYSEPLYIPKT